MRAFVVSIVVVIIAFGLGTVHDHLNQYDHLVHTSRETFRRTFLLNPGTWLLLLIGRSSSSELSWFLSSSSLLVG